MKLARILFTVQETAKKINEDKITAYCCADMLLSFVELYAVHNSTY